MNKEDRCGWHRVAQGLIPWSGAEYLDVLDSCESLDQTPRDDWDLRPRRLGIQRDDGVTIVELKGLMPESQIGFFITQKYRDRDHTTRAAHLMWDFVMSRFLDHARHEEGGEGGTRHGSPRRGSSREPGQIEVNTNLVQALAEAPYTTMQGRGRKRERTLTLRRSSPGPGS